ncbi:signal peptidase I [Enterococcus rivorum]|uniref:Signal peptidase I n=1 Tax=Enterococcus rivorum TaxID=762845 RepID=A0A1E5KYH2_9ENTE|nr:signal peptidase I [Enterococcus rivorum]MBP2099939.1 signal peptidase I [Enterococcus rivorum]OEH82844.1 signal peptidase I [Enterococcus rivorum]
MDEKRERKKKRRPQNQSSVKVSKQRKTEAIYAEKKTSQKRRKKSNRPPDKSRAKKTSNKKKRIVRRKKQPVYSFLFNFLFYAFILAIIGASILFATSKNTDKSVLGYRFFGVLTDSMVPRNPKVQKGGFHSGDIIVIKNIAGDEAEVGDIITFRPNIKSQTFLTHRVKKKLDHLGEAKGTYYITQGDANLAEDVPVNEKQVVGKKVFVVPKVGSLLNFVSKNLVVSIIFIISVFGFITIIRYYILNK